MKLRIPDGIHVYAEGRSAACLAGAETVFAEDARVRLEKTEGGLRVWARAERSALRYIRLRWNFRAEEMRAEGVRVLADAWERGYGDLEWRGIVPQRCMPWACLVSNGSDANEDVSGRFTEGFGVKARPSALCFWQYDAAGLTLWLDVRNGGSGVQLGGRELDACTVVFGEYRRMSAFRAGRAFYAALCDDAIEADHKVYGSNNWYYAYGRSSHEDILNDLSLIEELCDGLPNRPYMVIDDGWQKYNTDGPWDQGNERFPDMRALADGMKARCVRPGIWIRYLADRHRDSADVLPAMRLSRDDTYLDPSHPAVLEKVRRDTRRIVETWGYQLIKHDFSTFDIFGSWGFERPDSLTPDGWHFYDRTRTSAEIVVDFYRAIREAAGDAVLIGCNVIGHLAAGLVQANRTGDDTSGLEWERTRKMGANTLAFRLLHDKTFFAADADCVGITGKVDWELNRRWLNVLAASGTPLFVSCKPDLKDEAMRADLRAAFVRASVQEDELEPVDWMENLCPAMWRLNGQPYRVDWMAPQGAESFAP